MLGLAPAPVRSPSALPSLPTLEPPQLLKLSGRLVQVRVALLLAIAARLGKVTW